MDCVLSIHYVPNPYGQACEESYLHFLMGKPDSEKGSDLLKVYISKVLLGSLLCMPFGVTVSEMNINYLRPERNLHYFVSFRTKDLQL